MAAPRTTPAPESGAIPASAASATASGTAGGTPVPAPVATGVLGDARGPLQTEGAVTETGNITSHSGPPEVPGGPVPAFPVAPGAVIRRDVPPAPVVVEDLTEYLVKNVLQQPLHSPRAGTVPAGGTFKATAKEILAYGAQVQRVG